MAPHTSPLYDRATCMYYDRSTCMYYDHSTCMSDDHTCMYYDHRTWLTRWPYTRSRGEQLDSIQRVMVCKYLNIRRVAGETFERFVRRRNASISAAIQEGARWSMIWRSRMIDWHAHVQRNTFGACLSARILTLEARLN